MSERSADGTACFSRCTLQSEDEARSQRGGATGRRSDGREEQDVLRQASLLSIEHCRTAWACSSARRTASSYEMSSSSSVGAADVAARGAGTGAGAGLDDVELGAGDAAPGVLLVGERLTGAAAEMLVRATPFVMSRMPDGLAAAGAAATAGAEALAALAESARAARRQDEPLTGQEVMGTSRTERCLVDGELDGADSSASAEVVLRDGGRTTSGPARGL